MSKKVDSALLRIDDAVEQYEVQRVYALFSGGHDSLTTTHITSRHPLFAGVLHINTTIGIDETRQFVKDTCEAHGWPLYVCKAPTVNYQMFILKFGFPGPDMHSIVYRFLKERALEMFIRDRKREDATLKRVGLAAGARYQESVRRMGTSEVVRQNGAQVWINPIIDWSSDDCADYMETNGLRRNIVKDTMHISGECLCGCFTGKYERRELELYYPQTAEYIRKLEAFLENACELGLADIDPKYRTWGWGAGIAKEQTDFLPMCVYCRAARGDIEVT